MTIKRSIFLIILSAFVLFNCNDEPTSIGKDLVDNINLKIVNSSDDSLSQTFSFFLQEDVKLATAEIMLIGKSDSIDASALIKFNINLPDSIKNDILNNNIMVNSAVMELTQRYRFGEEDAEFDFTVHKINTNWSVNFTADSLEPGLFSYEAENLSQGVDETNDSITSVILSNQIVMDWLEIIADTSLSGNNGIYLKPSDVTQKVLGYQAINISLTNIPVIRAVIEKPGAYVDTITFGSTLDVGVIKGDVPPVSAENIPIRAGFIINAKLFFDLSTLPENITINKAELVLTVDTLQTKLGTSSANSLQTYFLLDSTNTDSISSNSITLRRFGDKFSGVITPFVRTWLHNNNNHGMVLKAASPLNSVDLYVFKGSNTADKPVLQITYATIN